MQAINPTPTHSLNGKFANDGSLESVEGMLTKLAIACHARVMAMGLPMEFEDVKQEMMLGYVKARQGWSPERARFNTYCYTVARNEFNRRIERMELDRARLGLASIDELASAGEDDDGDGYERYLDPEDANPSPLERMIRREEITERWGKLTPATKALVEEFTRTRMSAAKSDELPNLRAIAADMGLRGRSLQKVQRELTDVFGVRVPLGGYSSAARMEAA